GCRMLPACRPQARGRSRIGTSSSSPNEDIPAWASSWLAAVLETRGLTSLRDPAAVRRVLLDDSLRGASLVGQFEGPIVDVGSGGGAPSIPLAPALPGREVVLPEAERRKVELL